MNDGPRLYQGEADLQLTFPDGSILSSKVWIQVSQNKPRLDGWGGSELEPYRFNGQTMIGDGKGPRIIIPEPRSREIEKAIGEQEARIMALARELEDAKKTLSDVRRQLTEIPTS